MLNLLPRTRLHVLKVVVPVKLAVHFFFASSSVFPLGVGHLGTSGSKSSGLSVNPASGSCSSPEHSSDSGSSSSSLSLLHCFCPETFSRREYYSIQNKCTVECYCYTLLIHPFVKHMDFLIYSILYFIG